MTTVEPIRNREHLQKLEKYLAQKNLRDLLLFTLGTNCGLRISDIIALNTGDVMNKTYIQIIEKKTGKFKRFPINSKLKPMLDKYTKGKCSKEPLFLTKFHNRMDRFSAYRIIKKAVTAAGLEEKVGTHTMRKTFGYHHYKKYKDIAMLQKIFNHSSPQITLGYIGIDQERIDESYNNFIL
ncbi:MAG: site-specific integrase [Candidatus Gastranaerophilales bacterium]|nr:site-specific integrase [Candidatus Gastranaerophilales bacterium]